MLVTNPARHRRYVHGGVSSICNGLFGHLFVQLELAVVTSFVSALTLACQQQVVALEHVSAQKVRTAVCLVLQASSSSLVLTLRRVTLFCLRNR